MIKSRAVLSPAGSGKTEGLARRYIDLLKAGCAPERILTITFTEKAAAEMKQRIFEILERENKDLHRFLKSKILKLRITTIDSFCFSMVRRFALELNLEPDLEALPDPMDLWLNTRYDVLMRLAELGEKDPRYTSLLDLVTTGRMSGWNRLAGHFDMFFQQRTSIERARVREFSFGRLTTLARELRTNEAGAKIPEYRGLFPARYDASVVRSLRHELLRASDVFLTSSGTPRLRGGDKYFRDWCAKMHDYLLEAEFVDDHQEFKSMFELYQREFLAEYDARKKRQGWVDFSDMERLAWGLLTENAEWSNILLAFDEHTDHILVDEFQDTSYLQWGIVDKLTEEWRAGSGRKTEQGITPTIYVVGDDKQSIYLFRNAHAEVFTRARQKLSEWLGPERFEFKTIENNYRSLQRIIDFTNHVFGKLMAPPETAPAWQTRYSRFERRRNNGEPGIVELMLADGEGFSQAEQRRAEAQMIAGRVQSLIGQKITWQKQGEEETLVECSYGHITILLRNRNHLDAYEEALSDLQIPYMVQHGTGFYMEREIKLLNALLAALVDPTDDFNLYAVLRSPLFAIPESELFFAAGRTGSTLQEKLLETRGEGRAARGEGTLAHAIGRLTEWQGQVNRRPLAEIIEEVLVARDGWRLFWESQRRSNVRKFLQLIENFENDGMHPLRIKALLDTMAEDQKEPKANIDVRTENAVQIMTIHSAKGLQFPIVFCPAIDLKIGGRNRDSLLIEEKSHDEVTVSYLGTADQRKQDPMFIEYAQKLEEEEKRLFYVAVTRSRDALFLSGMLEKEQPQKLSWLKWLWDTLDIRNDNGRYIFVDGTPELRLGKSEEPTVIILNQSEVEVLSAQPSAIVSKPSDSGPRPLHLEVLPELPRLHVEPVTRDTRGDRKRHGDDTIAFGVVMHRILEAIAKSELNADDDKAIIEASLRWFAFEGVADELCQKHCDEIVRQIAALRAQGDLAIALPQPNSYAEMPFMLRRGDVIYNGRMDRLILRDDTVDVYDYKTFPVSPDDLDSLVEECRSQMSTYTSAAAALFPDRRARGFLLFTAVPRLVAVPA